MILKVVYIFKILNNRFLPLLHRINKLRELPKGFGACPTLEVLDLTYNNLTDKSFPGNFFYLGMYIP